MILVNLNTAIKPLITRADDTSLQINVSGSGTHHLRWNIAVGQEMYLNATHWHFRRNLTRKVLILLLTSIVGHSKIMGITYQGNCRLTELGRIQMFHVLSCF